MGALKAISQVVMLSTKSLLVLHHHALICTKKAAVMPQKSRYEAHPGEGRPVVFYSAGYQLEPRRPLYRYTLIIENLDSYTRAHYIRKVRRVAWQRVDTGIRTTSPPARKRHVQYSTLLSCAQECEYFGEVLAVERDKRLGCALVEFDR